MPDSVEILVRNGNRLPQLRPADHQGQTAIIIGLKLRGAVEREGDPARVGTRLEVEVVLELMLIGAVVDDVDSGVDSLVLDAGVLRDLGEPLRAVISEKIA